MKLIIWIGLLSLLIGHLLFFTFLSELQASVYGLMVIDVSTYFMAGFVAVIALLLVLGFVFHGFVYMVTRVPYGFSLWLTLIIGLIWVGLLIQTPEGIVAYITSLVYVNMICILFIKDAHIDRIYDISVISNWIFGIDYKKHPKMEIVRIMLELGQ